MRRAPATPARGYRPAVSSMRLSIAACFFVSSLSHAFASLTPRSVRSGCSGSALGWRAVDRPSRTCDGETSSASQNWISLLIEMRLTPFSYFCTCWKVMPARSASAVWLMPASSRSARRRVPTSRSMSVGDFTEAGRAGTCLVVERSRGIVDILAMILSRVLRATTRARASCCAVPKSCCSLQSGEHSQSSRQEDWEFPTGRIPKTASWRLWPDLGGCPCPHAGILHNGAPVCRLD